MVPPAKVQAIIITVLACLLITALLALFIWTARNSPDSIPHFYFSLPSISLPSFEPPPKPLTASETFQTYISHLRSRNFAAALNLTTGEERDWILANKNFVNNSGLYVPLPGSQDISYDLFTYSVNDTPENTASALLSYAEETPSLGTGVIYEQNFTLTKEDGIWRVSSHLRPYAARLTS